MICSIIIATVNRADALEQTLRALNGVSIPPGMETELLVVDNASTDATAQVVRNARIKNIPVKYLFEPRKGKSNALNAALARARGELLVFTDDDVRPESLWLESITRPLMDRACDAAVGRITLAPELHRAWMTPQYWGGISICDNPTDVPLQLVGANMCLHRGVFQRVPSFDPRLGPGALGLAEDTLFGWQLVEAGFRIHYIPQAAVLHYADASRLRRRHCISERVKYGASLGYVLHHWRHGTMKSPRFRYYLISAKLKARRIAQPPQSLEAEGMPPWEVSYVADIALCRQFLIERRQPRNYSRLGLVRLNHSNN